MPPNHYIMHSSKSSIQLLINKSNNGMRKVPRKYIRWICLIPFSFLILKTVLKKKSTLLSNQFLIQNLLGFENCFQNKHFKSQKTQTTRKHIFILFFCFVIVAQGCVSSGVDLASVEPSSEVAMLDLHRFIHDFKN